MPSARRCWAIIDGMSGVRRSIRVVVGVPVVAAALAATVVAAPQAAATPRYRVVTDAAVASVIGDTQPAEQSPPGSNVPGCRPHDAAVPVVLLHGTAQTQMSAWQYLAPTLANQGFCVYSLTYGQTSWSGNIGALGQREKSARQVAVFVDGVLAKTGAHQVDLIGFSQGNAVAQLFTQLPGRAGQTRQLISLGPSNKGVSKLGSITDRLPARAPGENDWGPLHSGIDYTMIMTRHDEISAPYTNGFLPKQANVRNLVIQDYCPKDTVGHVGLPYDSWVGGTVVNTLRGSRAPAACTVGFGL